MVEQLAEAVALELKTDVDDEVVVEAVANGADVGSFVELD